MRVFMLGWEFPPFISGGLGTACYGLTKAMSSLGLDVMFVLPRPVSTPFSTHVQLVAPKPGSNDQPNEVELRLTGFERVSFRAVDAQIRPYDASADYTRRFFAATSEARAESGAGSSSSGQAETPTLASEAQSPYSGDLFTEVQRYATLATEVARPETFDIIHAHDWMTFPAALAVAAAKNVPLVVHIHSTELDRSGPQVDQRIYDIERRGMRAAMKVIAVSHFTREQIIGQYGISPDKVEVVHNAIDIDGVADTEQLTIERNEKVVLFLGRITMQKGPEYFLAAARRVLEIMDNVKFVMAGSGDLIRRTVELAAGLGIGHKVLFTGFLRGSDVERVFRMADLYVMPSVSEPFGIAPLEAMSHDVPVIISKQSGVSEVLRHVLKVDFWDVNEMADKIIAVLRHPPLATTLREQGRLEVRRLSWTDAAKSCVEVYEQAREMVAGRT